MSEIPGGFVRPFHLDKWGGYIWDANNQMAADFIDDETEDPRQRRNGICRPRGWGDIHNDILRNGGTMEDAGAIMNAWEQWVHVRTGDCRNHEECVKLLNDTSLDT